MSSLEPSQKRKLEKLFDMESGYVLDFSDKSMSNFFIDVVDIDPQDSKYAEYGTSKAKRLRAFWDLESDSIVGTLLGELIDYSQERERFQNPKLAEECRVITESLLSGGLNMVPLEVLSKKFDKRHLYKQIERMKSSVDSDPELAIGTAKELIETCCKTIMEERGKPFEGSPDVAKLTKVTLKELDLVPESIADSTRGSDVIRRILQNLGAIGNGLAELRGLYGTGHGREAGASGLHPRHARMAVGAASTLAIFLFDTHTERKTKV